MTKINLFLVDVENTSRPQEITVPAEGPLRGAIHSMFNANLDAGDLKLFIETEEYEQDYVPSTTYLLVGDNQEFDSTGCYYQLSIQSDFSGHMHIYEKVVETAEVDPATIDVLKENKE